MQPSRLAFHILGAADFLARESRSEPLEPTHCGLNPGMWLEVPDADLPTKESLRGFFEETKGKWKAFLAEKPDEWFLAPKTEFPGTGPTMLEHCIYNIRHVMEHVGHIDVLIRQAKGSPVDWK